MSFRQKIAAKHFIIVFISLTRIYISLFTYTLVHLLLREVKLESESEGPSRQVALPQSSVFISFLLFEISIRLFYPDLTDL